MTTNNFKTTWDFMDCNHEDAMFLSWNDSNVTGSFKGGYNLTKEEQLHWHELEIKRLKSRLIGERSVITNNLGIQWANKNAQTRKSRAIKNLVAQKKKHSDCAKFLKSLIKEWNNAGNKIAK